MLKYFQIETWIDTPMATMHILLDCKLKVMLFLRDHNFPKGYFWGKLPFFWMMIISEN